MDIASAMFVLAIVARGAKVTKQVVALAAKVLDGHVVTDAEKQAAEASVEAAMRRWNNGK